MQLRMPAVVSRRCDEFSASDRDAHAGSGLEHIAELVEEANQHRVLLQEPKIDGFIQAVPGDIDTQLAALG